MFLIPIIFPPIVALLILIVWLKNRSIKKSHIIMLVFLVAFIGAYWFPWGDNQSHFAFYYSGIISKYFTWSLSSILFSTYWFYDLVIGLVANFLGSYTWGYFFWLLVPFMIFSLVIWKAFREYSPNKVRWLQLIFLLMFLGMREYLDLNRNTDAVLLFVSGVILLKFKKYVFSSVLFSLALLLHDSIRYFVCLLPIGCILSNLSLRKNNILLIIGFLLSNAVVNVILPMVVSERNLTLYLENAGNSQGVNSGFMMLQGWCSLFLVVVSYVLLQRHRNIIDKNLYAVFLTALIVIVYTFPIWLIRERFILIANISAAAIILIYWPYLMRERLLKFRVPFLYISCFVFKIFLNIALVISSHYVFNSATLNNEKEMEIVCRSAYMPTIFLFNIQDYGFSDTAFLSLYDRVNNTIENER